MKVELKGLGAKVTGEIPDNLARVPDVLKDMIGNIFVREDSPVLGDEEDTTEDLRPTYKMVVRVPTVVW